jgi:hypothetical protein
VVDKARLARVNPTTAFLVALVLVVGGLFAPGIVGGLILAGLAFGLGWLTWQTWPVQPPATRVIRLVLLSLLVAAAVAKSI